MTVDTVKGTRNEDPLKILGTIIPAIPSILFRFSGEYLRFKSKARKGGFLFQNQLINQGVDRATAEQLTEIYLEGSHLVKILFSFRQSARVDK
jgi:hypothetical protein